MDEATYVGKQVCCWCRDVNNTKTTSCRIIFYRHNPLKPAGYLLGEDAFVVYLRCDIME